MPSHWDKRAGKLAAKSSRLSNEKKLRKRQPELAGPRRNQENERRGSLCASAERGINRGNGAKLFLIRLSGLSGITPVEQD